MLIQTHIHARVSKTNERCVFQKQLPALLHLPDPCKGLVCTRHVPSQACVRRSSPLSGMRQAVYRYHAGRPGYTLVTRSSTYISDMATAKFCLAPTGGGHGKRQVRAFALSSVQRPGLC